MKLPKISGLTGAAAVRAALMRTVVRWPGARSSRRYRNRARVGVTGADVLPCATGVTAGMGGRCASARATVRQGAISSAPTPNHATRTLFLLISCKMAVIVGMVLRPSILWRMLGSDLLAGEGFSIDFGQQVYGRTGLAPIHARRAMLRNGLIEVSNLRLMPAEADGPGIGPPARQITGILQRVQHILAIQPESRHSGVIERGGAVRAVDLQAGRQVGLAAGGHFDQAARAVLEAHDHEGQIFRLDGVVGRLQMRVLDLGDWPGHPDHLIERMDALVGERAAVQSPGSAPVVL